MDASSTVPPSGRMVILGCGYVGRAVAQQARPAGWTVQALTRNPAKAAALREELGLEVIEGDLASEAWHAALDPDEATIVNCVSGGGGGEAGYARSYREGMRSLVAWARRGRVRQVIYTGSTSVYPEAGGGWVDETSPTAASTALNAILLEAEGVLAGAVESGTLAAATVLRLAGLYGPGRHYLIDRLRAGVNELPGRGDYHLNLLHRDDAAAAVLCLASAELAPGFRLFNVADGHPSTKEEIVQWTAGRLGQPAPRFNPDEVTARMARRPLFDGRPPDRRIDASRLRQEMGWTPAFPDFRAGYAALLGGEMERGGAS